MRPPPFAAPLKLLNLHVFLSQHIFKIWPYLFHVWFISHWLGFVIRLHLIYSKRCNLWWTGGQIYRSETKQPCTGHDNSLGEPWKRPSNISSELLTTSLDGEECQSEAPVFPWEVNGMHAAVVTGFVGVHPVLMDPENITTKRLECSIKLPRKANSWHVFSAVWIGLCYSVSYPTVWSCL